MKFLWMGTSPPISTGYGIVGNNVVQRLIKKGIDIKYLGLQSVGWQKEDWLLPVGDEVYGNDVLPIYLQQFNIDYLITIVDNWLPNFHYIPSVVKKLNKQWICHVTANSTPFSPLLTSAIQQANYWVAPSKFVEKLLLNVGFSKEKVKYIPHGVNLEVYKPLPEEEKQKVKEMTGYKDKFVFLNVATNKGLQKNWAGLFYAYKIFLEKTRATDTVLHIQTNPNPGGAWGGFDLKLLAKKFGIANNVHYISTLNNNAGFPPEQMNQLYNVADVHVSSTLGESFGLPMLESMACGVPQIMTDFSTCEELIKEPETGFGAKVKNMFTTPLISDQAMVDEYDMANKMAKMYNSEELRKKFGKNGIEFAKKYSWEKVVNKWAKFFKELGRPEGLNYREGKLGI